MNRRNRLRTLRGTIDLPQRAGADPFNTARRLLILDDGRINIGYRIIAFHVFNSDMTGINQPFSVQAHLSMSLDETSALPRASDNREIAWACYNTGAGESPSRFDLVDPDHIVVRDLNLIIPITDNVAAASVNYYVLMEEYDLTDQEAIISIIKEESQDVDN